MSECLADIWDFDERGAGFLGKLKAFLLTKYATDDMLNIIKQNIKGDSMNKKAVSILLALIMIFCAFSPVYAKMAEVRDHFYKLHFSDKYNDWTVYYHIPEILIGNKLDDSLSYDVNTHYMSLYEESKKYADRKENYPPTGNISYVTGQNDEIFSLVVMAQYMLSDDYYLDVYNMDKSTGKAMTDLQVLEKFGYKTRNSFIKDVKKVLPDIFDKLNSGAYPAVSKNEIQDALDYTLSEDALSWVKPYVNDDGQLCFIAWIGALAGSGAYLHMINLETGKWEGQMENPDKAISTYIINSPAGTGQGDEKPPVTTDRLTGDVNSDGAVDAKDATQILRHVNGKSSVISTQTGNTLTETLRVSDVNGDESVDAKDATQILRHVNGKTSVFDSMK